MVIAQRLRMSVTLSFLFKASSGIPAKNDLMGKKPPDRGASDPVLPETRELFWENRVKGNA
jgi:hypothetical protein